MWKSCSSPDFWDTRWLRSPFIGTTTRHSKISVVRDSFKMGVDLLTIRLNALRGIYTRRQCHAFDLSLVPPEPDLSFEQALWEAGLTAVAGIDEAGRGALAGPVSAAAVILPPDMAMYHLKGVRDSKQLTPDQREIAREKILKYAAAWGVGFATTEEIDQIGILPATRLAACRALEALSISQPIYCWITYSCLRSPYPRPL